MACLGCQNYVNALKIEGMLWLWQWVARTNSSRGGLMAASEATVKPHSTDPAASPNLLSVVCANVKFKAWLLILVRVRGQLAC